MRLTSGTSTTGSPTSATRRGAPSLYLYGWTLVLAGLALALRFVPYSDNRGHFDLFLVGRHGGADSARARRRQRLRHHRPRNPQAAPRPAQPGDRGIRGDRARARTLVTGSDKPHESGFSKANYRGPSDIVAHPPARPEPGGFYVSSQVRRPTACWPPRSQSFCLADCPCSATRSAPRPGSSQRGDPGARRPRAPSRARRRQPPEGDGDRRRDHARPRLADGDRGPARRPAAEREDGLAAARPRRSSSSPSPSPPQGLAHLFGEPEGQGARMSTEPRRHREAAAEVGRAQHQSQGLHRARRLPRRSRS